MKRSLHILLASLIVFNFMFFITACSSSDVNPDSNPDPKAGATAAPGSNDKPAGGKGPLKVGVKNNVVGFGYQDPLTNKYSGLEIDLADRIADELGYNGVEYTAVTAATRTELLDAGTVDCILATFTVTDERKESWDFSAPYYTDAVTVLVEKKSGISSLADLADKNVGVSTSSTSAKALATVMAEKKLIPAFDTSADFVPTSFKNGVAFTEFTDYPSISSALTAGTIDAFCVDKSILASYMSDDRTYIEEKFDPQVYGVATRKGSEISGQIDDLIKGWLEDGTIDKLISKYGLE